MLSLFLKAHIKLASKHTEKTNMKVKKRAEDVPQEQYFSLKQSAEQRSGYMFDLKKQNKKNPKIEIERFQSHFSALGTSAPTVHMPL